MGGESRPAGSGAFGGEILFGMTTQETLKAVLFDLDGLMVDTEPYQFGAFQVLLARRGIELPESAMAGLLGYDEVTNLRQLKPQYDLPETVEELLAERRQIYLELLARERVAPMAGFWEVSGEARRLGLKQAVVSSSTRAYVEAALAKVFSARPELGGFAGYFDAIVCGDEVENTKPAPDLYRLAVERLAVVPEECLALEDSPAGVRSARAAGARCLAVVARYARPEDFTGAAVFASLHDVLPYLRNSCGESDGASGEENTVAKES